mmetsp:Transcript_74310/g.168323  ORF Transcript_74310/g.168323 Transcript_74310/m.168323 type:complete len:475 (+) Transcript_74310:87-1511(+)
MSLGTEAGLHDRPVDVDAEPCHQLVDPLGDVIDWLGHADLTDEIGDEESGATNGCRAGGGAANPNGFAREPFANVAPMSPGGNQVPGHGPGGAASSGDAATPEPPLFTGRQKAAGSQRGITAYCGIGRDADPRSVSGVEPEEEEWDARQQQTGAAGRLVVYDESDRPRSDFLLRGGCGRRIMVTAVTDGGKAAQAGVKAGDVLVSIDGRKDFKERSADHVHASLKGPVMLVFMGFVGKLQAEVRLNYKQKVCGLSSQHQVVFGRPDAPVQVVDEVIFQPGMATLLLATSPPEPRRPAAIARSMSRGKGAAGADGDNGDVYEEPEGIDDVGDEGTKSSVSFSPGEPPTPVEALAAVYELRGPEARSLVNRALSRARTASPFAPRYVSPGVVVGDHAQVPRSITPSVSPFASRLDSSKLPKPSDVMPAKPFHFANAGGSDAPEASGGLAAQDAEKASCNTTNWLRSSSTTACPREH